MVESPKPGDLVKIYENTNCFKGGALVPVLDRDPDTGDLLCGKDLETAMWAKPNDMEVVSFKRPVKKPDWKLIMMISISNQVIASLAFLAWKYLG